MKNSYSISLFLSLFFTYSIPAQDRWQLIDSHLASQQNLSGYFIMGSGGEISLRKAIGLANRAEEIPFSDKTLYSIGSITKSITATAILVLEERGKLKTTDLITKYYEAVPADKQSITIHHLLTHSAGFGGALGDDYEVINTADFTERAFRTPLHFTPGNDYMYSNVGYSLLGIIIEKLSGESYDAFIQKNIFAPAGMKTAGYTNPNVDYMHIAHGYLPDGSDWGTARDKTWNGSEPYWHLKANGGILVSADDMYRFYLALRNNTILSKASLAKQVMAHVKEGEDDSYYGYGFAVSKNGEVVQHNGSNRIFKADFRWFPKEDKFLFAVTNDANVRLFRLNDELIDIMRTGQIPAQFAYEPVSLATFPNGQPQETAATLTALLKEYTDAKADAFIRAHCTEGIINRNGIPKLKEVFTRLSGDIGSGALQAVNRNADSIQLIFPATEPGANLKISLVMHENKIDRLTAEMEGR
jgi:CubicO group peptidase (beta-lactamase class C family)